MKVRLPAYGVLVLSVSFVAWALVFPGSALAKVFFYALTVDGDLVKYDPDADRIVQFRPRVGQPHINRRNTDNDNLGPTRVLDLARARILTFTNEDPGVVLIDLQAGRATEIAVGPSNTVANLRHLVYPRKGSRFYVNWVRKTSPNDSPQAVLTAVDLNGQVLGTMPSPIAEDNGGFIPHLDGRTLYVLNEPNELLRIEGETLVVRETYDVSTFYRTGATGHRIADVRDGRALLVEGEGTRNDMLDPMVLFTVDLSTRTATSRISSGLGASETRLLPGGRTILLQEARTAFDAAGAGRLHFYDASTGNKVGTVSFRADLGAILLGFHPDGRRLFIRADNRGASPGDLEPQLVIVDVVTRSVLRQRAFQEIGVAVDFVDEP